MKYLLDTCCISETVKGRPNPRLVEWLGEQPEETLFISVLTLGELHKGVARLPESPRRTRLETWVNGDLPRRFGERTLSIDPPVVVAWGARVGASERKGVSLPIVDSLMAATAEVHGLAVVTQNVKDFERCGSRVVNPWR